MREQEKLVCKEFRPLLTRKEVANQLNVCVHTVARLQRRGVLHAVKINSQIIRYYQSDVDQLLAEATV